MVARLRLIAALGALVMSVVMVWQHTAPTIGTARAEPETGATVTPSKPVNLTNPRPFDPCEDIPFDVVAQLGLAFTPPRPVEGLRCEYDAGNYQMAIEPFIWRSYAETLPADALETTINGHRAAQYWVMKPTEWNNRWWVSCMVTFKTSYGVIQQALYYAQVYSNPRVDCPSENLMRAEQLSPHYIF